MTFFRFPSRNAPRGGRAKRRGDAGLSLVEILVSLAIIALVLAVVVPRLTGALNTGQKRTAELELANIANGLALFRLDVGRFPSEQEGLEALVQAPSGSVSWNGPYLSTRSVPLDPWGNPYVYRYPPKEGIDFDLLSLGADGRLGGTGEAADIKQWELAR